MKHKNLWAYCRKMLLGLTAALVLLVVLVLGPVPVPAAVFASTALVLDAFGQQPVAVVSPVPVTLGLLTLSSLEDGTGH